MTLINLPYVINITKIITLKEKKQTRSRRVLLSPGFGAGLPDNDCGSCRAHQILCDAGLGPGSAFSVFFCNSNENPKQGSGSAKAVPLRPLRGQEQCVVRQV